MTTPNRTLILQPPTPEMIKTDPTSLYRFILEIWNRTGGFNSSVPQNLKDLKASVAELNQLQGIHVDDTVQQQLDSKISSASLGSMAYQRKENVDISGGKIVGTNISAGTISGTAISIPTGSNMTAKPSGTIYCDNTTKGNLGAGEQTLLMSTIIANTLIDDNSYLEIQAFGTLKNTANTKQIKLKIGGAIVLDTGAKAADSGYWEITATLLRISSTNLKCIARIISSNTLIADSVTYELLSISPLSNFDVLCAANGQVDNDIVQEGLVIKYFK